MRQLLINAALLISLLVFTSADTYYVKPLASTIPCPEEGVPCFTLSQYAKKPYNYFTSNTILILLPGNHSLDSALELWKSNIESLNIAGNTTATVTCSQSARFTLNEIGAVSMRGLVLIGCMNNKITNVEKFILEDCSLQGQGRYGIGLELKSVASANIVRSSFSSFTGKEIILLDPYWGFRLNFKAGGAIIIRSSTLTIFTSKFTNNAANSSMTRNSGRGGVVYAWFSNVTMISNTFNNNIASGSGGVVYVDSSGMKLHNNTFNNNIASGDGGAVYADSSSVTLCNNTFDNNIATGKGGAVYAYIHFRSINNNGMHMKNNTFNINTVTGDNGQGGAVYAVLINLTMNGNTFKSNVVTGEHGSGGAVYAHSSNLTMSNNAFTNNTVTGLYGVGGAVRLYNVTLNSNGFLTVQNNRADAVGVIYAIQSSMYFSGNTTISNNYGSLYAYACNVTFMGLTNIMNNSYTSNTSQEGGAVTVIQSEIVFNGTANLSYNKAINGGAISAIQSKLHYVHGDITIAHNTASLSGGGIYGYQSEVSLENHLEISNNSAVSKGGGIHGINTIIRILDHSKTNITSNQAKRGGGVCLEMNAKLYFIKNEFECYSTSNSDDCWSDDNSNAESWIRLEFTENSANYGGALYITDNTNSGTCHATPFIGESTISSECFIQILSLRPNSYHSSNINIRNTFFTNNSARKAGDVIYGGVLDRCTLRPMSEYFQKYQATLKFLSLSAVSYILNITNLNIVSTKMISSDPVRVCFCQDNQPDCSYHPQSVYVRKGETFTVSLVAVDQVNNTISNSTIHGSVPLPASLGEEQAVQMTNQNGSCTELMYTILSPHNSEVLSLYAKGPCMDTGISKANLRVYILPCPVGFKDNKHLLICDCDRLLLNQYISNCSIDNQTVLRKDNVWFSYVNTTDHPHSYILHKHCPFDYCLPPSKSVHVNLTIPNGADALCAFNRASILCGSCKDGLSLSLGTSRCMACSNNWLALLIVFAFAGVALVAFLLVCNFTVSAGTVNGLLFYANIVSSNKAIFFPSSTNKFFAIFIAWLNLDFGFETCFFHGLNGYWNTWLQLAFPAYVIFLVVLVIKACEYSPRFGRLIARKNPVATLNTLVLLSYTKFIRTIISAWQFAKLEYSNGTHEFVWLMDGNIKYFELKHIPLFVSALVILAAALIYTLLLFLWQWLLLCPNRKPVSWIRNSRLHGIMDAYFITFNKNHRYWTGLLLLARVLLYLVSALNGMRSNDPRMNLYAIILVVGSLAIWKDIIKGKIYRKWPLNFLDTSFLFNLLILAATTFYNMDVGGNQTAVVSTSVSIAFITFILIILYHVYAFVLYNQVERMKGEFKKGNDSQFQQNTSRSRAMDNDHYVTVSEVEVPLIPLDSEGNPILDGFDTDEEDEISSETGTNDNKHSPNKRRAEENQSETGYLTANSEVNDVKKQSQVFELQNFA